MQLKYQPALRTRRVAIVTLESPQELALTNDELMLIVDNHHGIAYDHATNSYVLTGEGFGPKRHFGGTVTEDADPAVKMVSVYID